MVFRDDTLPDEIMGNGSNNQPGSSIVRVVNEKTTRQGQIYEVVWADGRKSLVKECNLPQTVQENVRNGINYQQEIVPINEFGQKRIEFKQTQTSKPELQPNMMAAVQSCGFAFQNEDDTAIVWYRKSQTSVKESQNCRNLGSCIPCGIVVDVKELFNSESKTQVYAHLHQLLKNSSMAKTETICYDDACHLKKFAQNTRHSCQNFTAHVKNENVS